MDDKIIRILQLLVREASQGKWGTKDQLEELLKEFENDIKGNGNSNAKRIARSKQS